MHTPGLNDTHYERMARHLAGESAAAERGEFERWLSEDPTARAEFDLVSRDWQASSPEASVDVGAAWSKLHNSLRGVHTGSSVRTQARWWQRSETMMRAAAVGLVAVTGALIARRAGGREEPSVAAAAAPVALATKVAERRELRLPDGTEIVLGAASSLRTLPGYGGTSREVELNGEAAFHVTHDAERPFRVQAGAARVEDLGTRFVVRAIGTEPVRVAVSEGSVSVAGASGGTPAILNPRDMALVTDSIQVTRNVDVDAYAAWASGPLVFPFRGVTLRAAIAELERWYDVDFRVTDADLLARTITATFEDLSTDQMLDVLGTTLGVRFEREGRIVKVAPSVRSELAPSSSVQVGSGA